jgi:hypothetical protein
MRQLRFIFDKVVIITWRTRGEDLIGHIICLQITIPIPNRSAVTIRDK